MDEVKRIRTACRNYHGGCGVIAHVKDGKVIKVEGDPASPISHGTLCAKGLAITQLAYHPERVLYPMRKGDEGWARISWDEALDTVCEKFRQVIQEWWFPELEGPGHGWDIANVNILTDNALDICDPVMGATNLRVLLCNISPCEDQ